MPIAESSRVRIAKELRRAAVMRWRDGGHALAGNGIRENFIDGLDVIDGLRGIDGEYGIANDRRESLRIERRTNQEDGVEAIARKVYLRFGIGFDAEIAGVGDDADDGDLAGSRAENADEDVGSEWVA